MKAVLFLLVSLVSRARAGGSSDFAYYQDRGTNNFDSYTISRGLEHYSWVWYPTDPQTAVHCFVFCMGTGAIPEDYIATGRL